MFLFERMIQKTAAHLLLAISVLLLTPQSVLANDSKMLRSEESLLKLAKRDDSRAQLQLGLGYLTGKHEISRDPKKAWLWLRKAAEPRDQEGVAVRNPRALLYVGICYDEYWEFLGLEHDKQKALENYLLAIDFGLPQGHHYAAFTYRELGDDKNAAKHFKAAAEFGNQVCQVEYAKILLDGIGVDRDPPTALPVLEKAAQAGSTEAQLLLADVYAGKYPPILQDYGKMMDYLWNAASTSAAAMTRVGYCYEHGLGINQDLILAVRWYHRAAEAGDPHAMINLGACYAQGKGVRKDPVRALQLYLEATSTDKPPALAFFNVAASYATGVGAEPHPARAFEFFRRAAELGSVSALYRIGLAYETGMAFSEHNEPLPESPGIAVTYYEKAAAAEHPLAIYRLALCYIQGKGVAPDPEKGKLLLTKAAELESSEARQALTEMDRDDNGPTNQEP